MRSLKPYTASFELRKIEDLLQKLYSCEEALFMTLLDFFQPFTERSEF